MSQSKIDILQRALDREKLARKSAERILEDKSRELFEISEELKTTNAQLANLLDKKSFQLQVFFDTILDAYLVMNLKGHIIKMNDAAKDLFEYDIDKEKLNVVNLIYKEDEKYAFESFNELCQKGFFHNYTARIISKSNQVKWVQINASIIYNDNNEPIAAQGIIRDITKSREDTNLIVESKNRLASLIENLDSGVLLQDENNRIILTNEKYCEFFKIIAQPDELIGIDTSNTSHLFKHLLKEPKKFTKRVQQLLTDKKEVLAEEVLMADGTILERNFIPILKEGKYNGHLWTYKDVSLSREYNRSLEAQKNKFSGIIANMNLGLLELDKEQKISFANQSYCEMSGYSKQELLGNTIHVLLPYKGGEKFIEKRRKIRLEGKTSSYEVKIITKDKKTKYWFVSSAPNYNLKGENIGTIAVSLDITKLKNLEKQKTKILKELEKRNNELEEYAHIVSHDLKSPLRSINALTNWIKTDNEGKFDEITLQNFDLLENTLEKMEQLISDILTYSSVGTQTKIKNPVNLQLLIQDLQKVIYIPKNISINIINTLPTIYGDKVKFQQLFQNLISNAVKFCDKEKGLVEINVTEQASFYEFSIKDNGIGIEKKYHEKIFKIFHSLQESKTSTGIGLSIVKKIIELYNGEIWIASEPNIGTTFFFTIKK